MIKLFLRFIIYFKTDSVWVIHKELY